jgi:poly-gamma-glutamate synthesis protein (capsule biosynthesis protein)
MTKIVLGLVGETNVNRPNPESAFDDVKTLLAKADVLVGHLESPVIDTPSTNDDMPDLPFKRGWNFSTPDSLQAWKSAGFDAVGVASNVSGNAESIVCTAEELDRIGLPHAGIGKNKTEARKPALFEKNGVKFGVLSYTSVFYPMFVPALAARPGAATVKAVSAIVPSPRNVEMPGVQPTVTTWLDPEEKAEMLHDVKQLRATVDYVILSCHWGVSDAENTLEYQKEFAHAAIDAGADVIIGHHPHRPQGVEVYKGKPVFYSMGNFAFDWWFLKERNKEGFAAFVTLDGGRVEKVSFVPCSRRSDNQIAPADFASAEGSAIIEAVKKLSDPMGTEVQIEGDEVILMPKTI